MDDAANALMHLMTHYSDGAHVNVGFGTDLTILELAQLIVDVMGFSGRIVLDLSKPDGPPRKLLDTNKLAKLGWRPKIGLEEGLAATYQWFVHRGRATGLWAVPDSVGGDKPRSVNRSSTAK
jgi:GDP-L-fucose synthase